MEKCKFNLNFKGQNMEFSSEEELNSFLRKNYDVLMANRRISDVEYSKVMTGKDSPALKVYSKLLNFQTESPTVSSKIVEGGEKEILSAKYQSVTKYINELIAKGGTPGVYFSTENYIKTKTEEIREALVLGKIKDTQLATDYNILKSSRDAGTITESQFMDQINAKIGVEIQVDVDNWAKLAKMGTNLHALAEMFFKAKIDGTLEGFASKDFPLDVITLNDTGKKNYIAYLHSLDKYLKELHGAGSIMIPEYKVYHKGTNGANLVGIIDLLVIDEKGNAHVYDYKTSYKDPSDWHSSKEWSYKLQLGLYGNMLKNKGVSVSSLNVLPIVMEDIDFAKESIKDAVGYGVQQLSNSMDRSIKDIINGTIPLQTASFFESAADITQITEPMKNAFGYSLKLKVARANIEEFIKNKVEDHPDLPGVKRYWNFAGKSVKVDARDLQSSVEEMYKKDSENTASELQAFKSYLQDCMDGKRQLRDFNRASQEKNNVLVNAFSKYVDGSWEMTMDDEAHDNLGIIMMVNKNTQHVEFISYTVNRLSAQIPLSLGNSLLGNFVKDAQAQTIRDLLPATNGNIEAQKVLFYIQANAKKFKENGYKLGEILVYNNLAKEFYRNDTNLLLYNFDYVARKLGITNNLLDIELADKYDVIMERITGIMNSNDTNESEKYKINNYLTILAERETGKLDALYQVQAKLQTELRQTGSLHDFSMDTPTKRLLGLVSMAISYERGVNIRFEKDIQKWTWNSLMFSNPTSIPSYNLRQYVEITKASMANIRRDQSTYKHESERVVDEFLKKKDVNTFRKATLGDNMIAYENLYERDSTGKKLPSLMFKNPYDPNSKLDDNERKFLKYFLEQVNFRRYRTTSAESEIAKNKIATGEWLQVPLLRTESISKFMSKDYRGALKEYWDSLLNTNSIFEQDRVDYDKQSDEMLSMFNTFDFHKDQDAREKLIAKEGINAFEYDLEAVMDAFVFNSVRQKEYNKVLPLMNAIKFAIAFEAFELNLKVPNMIEFTEKYTKSAIYNEKDIPPGYEQAYKYIAVVKNMTSSLNMVFSPVTGLVNFMQGQWGNMSRIMAKTYGKEMFSKMEYHNAMTYMCVDAVNSIDSLTKVEALNRLYGINSMDSNALPQRMQKNRGGLLNFLHNKMYWMSYAPDYFNRMSIFIAQMQHDGCFEAHTVVDGKLVYDFKKDKRFSEFARGNKSHPEYKNQRALYDAMRLDFNKEGLNIEYNESNPVPLPQAYNLKQRESLKAFSDSIHGYYDHESKVQANNTILGILFGQFKTWMTAKKDQWVLTPGIYAQGNYRQIVKDGVKYYKDAKGNPTTEDTGDPLLDWDGNYMEGIFHSLKAITMEWKQANFSLNTLWDSINANDARVSNLKLMGFDLFIILAAALIGGLVDWPSLEKDDAFTFTMARALIRSTNDLSLLANTKSLLSLDSSPFASFAYSGDLISGAWQVMTGSKHFDKFIFSNVGALRPFEGLLPK